MFNVIIKTFYMEENMQLNRRKYINILLLTALLSLVGCDETIDEKQLENINDKDINTNKETDVDDMLNDVDISEYGLYDDTMVKGLVVSKPNTKDKHQYIFQKMHHFVLDSELQKENSQMISDIKDEVKDIIPEEIIDKSYIVLTLDSYEAIDHSAKYGEKRIYFKYDEDGKENIRSVIIQQFADPNQEISTYAREISFLGESALGGMYVDSTDQLVFSKEDKVITEFNIPKGLYTKDDLLNIVKDKKKKSKKKKK